GSAAQSVADYASGTAAKVDASLDKEKAEAWEETFQNMWNNGASLSAALADADMAIPASAAWLALREIARKDERDGQAKLLHCIFGPLPFRPVTIAPSWLAWNQGTVVRLARSLDEDRTMPEGTLDPERMAVLADALIESGCDEEEMIRHCRGAGPHYRGCFAVDLLLG